MNGGKFVLLLILTGAAAFGAAWLIGNAYLFFAGYVVLQYIALATAWNILGGYTGYVNFGTAAFFALGAYTTVALHKLTALPIPIMMLAGGLVSGLVGLGTGYLTLRLRGAFFSIATLALAVVVQTLITNWNFVGGSRGAYIVTAADGAAVGHRLYPISFSGHAGTRGDCSGDGADDRALSPGYASPPSVMMRQQRKLQVYQRCD